MTPTEQILKDNNFFATTSIPDEGLNEAHTNPTYFSEDGITFYYYDPYSGYKESRYPNNEWYLMKRIRTDGHGEIDRANHLGTAEIKTRKGLYYIPKRGFCRALRHSHPLL